MGQRRGWLFILQLITISAVFAMGLLEPQSSILTMISLSVLISLAAASQHVILLAYQVQTLQSREWGVGEGISVFGFRMGLLTSGAGALYLASFLSWNEVYLLMAGIMGLALLAILFIPEPQHRPQFARQENLSILGNVKSWFKTVGLRSYTDFMKHQGWHLVILFMMIYRLPDHILGPMPSLFFLDLGFTKAQIATVSKLFGLIMTVLGGLIGGLLLREWSFHKTLLIAGIFHGLSMMCFLILLSAGNHLPTLYTTIALEHFSSGMGLTAFFSYQFSQCNPKFAATQLAMMTAAAAVGHRLGGVCSGFVVDALQWSGFFWVVTLSAIPGIMMIRFLPGQRSHEPIGSIPQPA